MHRAETNGPPECEWKPGTGRIYDQFQAPPRRQGKGSNDGLTRLTFSWKARKPKVTGTNEALVQFEAEELDRAHAAPRVRGLHPPFPGWISDSWQ